MGEKNNTHGMRPWNKGDLLLASKLDEPRQVLERQKGVSPGNQIRNFPQAQMICQQMQVVQVKKDYFTAEISDSNGTGGTLVNVALPHLLQQTHYEEKEIQGFLRRNISYEYKTNVTRTATNADDEDEEQVIVPSYEVGDVIIAFAGISGGTNVLDENDETVIWMDMNIDGRFWAASSEDEE